MNVTVYTLPSCMQCEATKKYLSKNSIGFNEVDMSQDLDSLEMVKGLGYASAPVIVAGEQHWSGYRPDRLAELHQND